MHDLQPLGTIARLWRYPVKSLAAEDLEHAAVDEHGLAGDRARALFVATPGHARSGKPYRGKEHELLHTVRTAPRAIDLAAERDLELDVRGDGPHFDAGVVSLVVDTWLGELGALVHLALDPLRFRPNLYVRADAAFALGEADLVGARIDAGDAILEVVATIKRCVTTTYDIETGTSEPAVLRTLAAHRANVMGVYCDVVKAGTLVRGGALTLVREP